MSEQENELHKEFELERIILFSDAVFAIAITLIIIEIKFPEVPKNADAHEIWKEFAPVLIQFGAFVLSFFFIGLSWTRHLKLFRYLARYDMGLVTRNLFFLFFIVCLPFSTSGITEHIRPSFLLPLLIYVFNIAAVMICQFITTHYIFRVKPGICIPGYENEKKYLLLTNRWIAIIMGVCCLLYTLAIVAFPSRSLYMSSPVYLVVILVVIMRRRLKKYKPASFDEMK